VVFPKGITEDQRLRFRATQTLGLAVFADIVALVWVTNTAEDIVRPSFAFTALVLLVPGLSVAAVLLFGVMMSPPKDMPLLPVDSPLRVWERDPIRRLAQKWLLGGQSQLRLLITVAPTAVGVLLLLTAY
jgi:hypothetical protein